MRDQSCAAQIYVEIERAAADAAAGGHLGGGGEDRRGSRHAAGGGGGEAAAGRVCKPVTRPGAFETSVPVCWCACWEQHGGPGAGQVRCTGLCRGMLVPRAGSYDPCCFCAAICLMLAVLCWFATRLRCARARSGKVRPLCGIQMEPQCCQHVAAQHAWSAALCLQFGRGQPLQCSNLQPVVSMDSGSTCALPTPTCPARPLPGADTKYIDEHPAACRPHAGFSSGGGAGCAGSR